MEDAWCTADPKRLCRKVQELRAAITDGQHFRLGDVLLSVPERVTSSGEPVRIDESAEYKYVEIANAEAGAYRWQEARGWELPARARHFAESGDLYLGAVWGSVRKWLFIGKDVSGLVVTNGFHRMRLIEGKEKFFTDLIAGLCTEAYTTQMRALARGSDGLAEVSVEDALSVVLPKITRPTVRAELEPFADQLRAGYTSAEAKVTALATLGRLTTPVVERRPDHTAVV